MSDEPARHDAWAAGLRYVDPDDPGIQRVRSGRGFRYRAADGRPIRARAELERIRSIAIPPAWTEVWICPVANGHLQAVGRDSRGRRQYRYHAAFRSRRDGTKFGRLVAFGAALPRIRRRVRRDLARRGMPREKVLAAVISLLDMTRFRVGNPEYARLNRSFGLSTLRNRHVTFSGGTMRLRFRGKGGRTEEGTVVDRRLAAVVRRCQELPGQALFEYEDADAGGELRAISSEDVNAYLREAAGSDEFTAKDFRAWHATVLAHRALRSAEPSGASASPRKGARRRDPIREAIRATAEQINDTPAVTRSAYVHPAVLAAFDPGVPRRAASRRIASTPIDRAEELEVLAILRAAARRERGCRPRPPARRAQPVRRASADRTNRPAA